MDAWLSGACFSEPVVRLYTMPVSITLGYRQKPEEEVLPKACELFGVQLSRRISGGKALLHDLGLTWSIALPRKSLPGPVKESFRSLCEPVLAGLQEFCPELTLGCLGAQNSGLKACMLEQGESEAFLLHGKKVAGAAQRRTRDMILQHGEIRISSGSLARPWELFVGLDSRDGADIWNSRTTSLGLSVEEIPGIKEAILHRIGQRFGTLRTLFPTAEDQARIEEFKSALTVSF